MRHLPVLAATVACLALPVPANAIVGGGPADAGEYPYVANIEVALLAGCTGSLVAPRWVVTAGHCAAVLGPDDVPTHGELPPQAFRVVLGTVNSDGSGDRTRAIEEHAVASVHVHPGYAATKGTGSDVALLELAEPSRITPVRIAAPGDAAYWEPGDALTIAGFGVTKEDGDVPDRLQEAVVPRIADGRCAQAYDDTTPVVGNAFDPATALCAGLPQGGRDTCQGDSGGPLLAPAGRGFRLVGATSYGEGCAREGLPGVYARVAEGSVKDFVAGLAPKAFAPRAARATCAGTRGLAVRVRGHGVRRLVVFVGGVKVAVRRGPGRVGLARHLPRGGKRRVRVVVTRRDGERRVRIHRYEDCERI